MASTKKSDMEEDLANQILTAVETCGKEGIMQLMQENPSLVKEILINLCDNDHLLHRVCILGDEELIVFLTAFTSDINAISPMGTPLSLACEHGYESVVDILLCNQAMVAIPVPIQVNPLAPVAREEVDAIHRLCPFYQAATNGWMNILKMLIEAKPETFEEVENCKNLLKITCYGGHADILQFCLDSLTKGTSTKEALVHFVCWELLIFCLEFDLINVLSCLLNAKSRASITEDLAEKYSAVVGRYLNQFVVETDHSMSQDDGQTPGTDQHSTLVSADWSGRSLRILMSSWFTPYITSLHDLDLRDNHLPILPDVVPWQLVNLRSFIVSNCHLKVLLSPSARILCPRLQLMDLSCNLLTDLPVELFDLPSLQKLNLSHNQLSCLYLKNSETEQRVQWECVNLKELNVSQNQIDSLPFQILSCINLTNLYASNNRLCNFVHPWSCPLKVLDLSENELHDLPLALDDFWSKSLQFLDLSRNSLTDLPQTICRLAALKDLNLSHNNISALPNPDWWECMSLESLDLSYNRLGSLPSCPSPIADIKRSFVNRINPNWFPLSRSVSTSPKKDLTIPFSSSSSSLVSFPKMFSESLTELNLSHNQLKEVPPSITEFRELTKLDLSHNQGVTSLPVELSQLTHLHTLLLEGLNIADNNLNRRIQSAESARVIVAYLKQIHRQCVPYHRIKLMLVGSQEKGKTSLAYALRDQPRPLVNVATNGVEISEFKLSAHSRGLVLKKGASPELTVQMWDFAGQQDYYVTHKVFLSPSALYLVIYDLRLGKQGVDGLHTWLSDIQANAPDSIVIIVGTFLDCLAEGRNSLPDLRNYIQTKYFKRQGFPRIDGIVEVSNIGRKEGLDTLRKFVYDVALKIRVRVDNYGKTNLAGRMFSRAFASTSWTLLNDNDRVNFMNVLTNNLQVPKDYLELIKVLQAEVQQCRKDERWPVLSADEFWNLFSSLQNNNIRSKEEMELAAQFLNESGYLLHYVSSSFNGLEPLYFIDPHWLAQILAKFVAVDSVQRFTRGGLINLKDAETALLFSGTKTSISFDHYVDLLESFDIALRLDNNKLLLPSKLPSIKPGLQRSARSKSLRIEAGQLHRIYRMNHVPSGFWSRLLVQILAAVHSHQGPMEMARRSSDGSASGRRSLRMGSRHGTVKEDCEYKHLGSLDEFTDPKITFWQEGIYINCSDYHLLIEPVDDYLQSDDAPQSENSDDSLRRGIVITVTKTSGEEDQSNLAFILATFAIDYIDSLIYQWYPGLLDEGCLEQLIPCPYCLDAKQDEHPRTFQDVHMFSLIECAKTILASQSTSALTIRCSKCNSPQIHLKFLVPDLLLLDLPKHLHIDASDLDYNPTADILGQGGEGTVFRGKYHGQQVAIKQNAIIQSCQTLEESMRAKSDSNDSFQMVTSGQSDLLISDFFWKSKTLSAFNGFRQETCVLARLRHPCIISLLGISAWSLSYVMELSPHGSLRHVLLRNQEMQTSMSDREGKLLLNKLLVYKIIFQIICGLQYLHSEGIVYKDLKPENVLTWSLDVEDVVNIKLSDYGLARRLTKQGLMGIDGTTGYQAPEIRQQKPYNEKVDIFAYAMVVHELVTGEASFHEVSSVLINKFILQGKRPINSGSRMVAPQMMSLIERCWAQNPNDRPSASEISSILRNLAFVCREMVVCLEANRILGGLSVTYWDKTLGVHHPYLRFWTGNESGRCYHIFNAAVGQFKILNQCHPGPKVSCMIVFNKLMIIGTEYPSSLQAMGFKRATNRLDKLPDPMPTDDVPLLLLQNQKMSSELYVGFANSEFHLYSLDVSSVETVYFKIKQSLKLSDGSNHAIISGLSFREGNELWVSCGPNIVVLNSSSESIHPETTIKIFPLVSSRHIISRMCCHADQVWCMSRKDSVVVELDFESRNVLCILDCSQSKPLDNIISNFDWVDTLRATTAEEQEVQSSPVVEAIPKVQFGRKDRQGRSTSYRRKLMTRAKSRSTEKYKHPVSISERVRSMCYVRGALWVGRENGDILVVNVTHSNPYDFEHGKVLAILNLADQEKSYSTEDLVNMSDERVIATRTSREVKAVRQSTQLVCWSALGLDKIHQYRKIWKVLADETAYKKAKSFKSPSFFTPK